MCGGGSKAAATPPTPPTPPPPPPPPRKVATKVENPLSIAAITGNTGGGAAGLTYTEPPERGVRIV